MTELGEYLDELRKRHPRLSMLKMALEAEVGDSVIHGIIKRGRGARPATLRKIADRWGGDDPDHIYRELMRRAGHPVEGIAEADAHDNDRGGGPSDPAIGVNDIERLLRDPNYIENAPSSITIPLTRQLNAAQRRRLYLDLIERTLRSLEDN